MKIIELFFLIYINSVVFINTNIICSVDRIRSHNNKINKENKKVIINQTNKRKIDSQGEYSEYEPINIYFSLKELNSKISNYQGVFNNLINISLLNRIFLFLNNTKLFVEKLIKVKKRTQNIVITKEEQKEELSIAEDNLLIEGVKADLVIIPTFIPFESGFDIEIYKRDNISNRVIVSKLIIPAFYLNKTKVTQFEVEALLLHEITHILGFHYENYQYFPGGINNVVKNFTETDGKIRYYIATPTVVELAKEYYGCDSLIGLELENQENLDTPSSHWESRILLGEYMNVELYTPEIVISDFTLALLEDSGWYEVNYFTGGLMRFGKNKGCNFLTTKCLTESKESPFKNEFFGVNDINNPSCSSGRLSRTYCLNKTYSESNFIGNGGMFKNADYCYIFYFKQEEENNHQFIGNCKMGNGGYGSAIKYINYNNNNLINIKNNGDLEEDLGETYSNNSFCVLSDVYDIYSDKTKNIEGNIHPICYEMFCSDKTLTIKIKEQYIVCPREGGKVRVYNNSNYNLRGYIYCPDYNLICTGSVICNDMFDCIMKESIPLKPNYTYIVTGETSSQQISKIKDLSPSEGYELSSINGICPINCAQCDLNKKCKKCRNGYNIIVDTKKENNPTLCDNNITNISLGYFLYDDAYYPCFEFCEECENASSCKKCDNSHVLNKNKSICFDKIKYCDIYNDEDFSCQKCDNGYAFLEKERRICNNISILNKEKFFTFDGGISYYPCDTNIKNCEKCDNKNDTCSQCKSGYYFLENNRTFCFSEINLTNYYTNDDGISFLLCNKTISNCYKCNTNNLALKCNLCEKDYYFLEDKRDNCYNNFNLDKYFTEDDGISYYPCDSTFFPKCEKCFNNKTKCQKCIKDYYFIGDNKDKCEYISDNDLNKYFSEDNNISYHLCDIAIEGCEQCLNRNTCTKCLNNYYFLDNIRNRCYKLNLTHYYKEGEAYFPCNATIPNCDICTNKTICILCSKNYYFLENNRSQCFTGINLNKYYTLDNGISYFLCNSKLRNCEECYDDKICYKCNPNYFFKDNDRSQCYPENELLINKTYYKYNDTFYRKCSYNILNCETCSNDKECDTCFKGYFFLDDIKTKCINLRDIDKEKYYLYDEYNYHRCSSLIDNCEECNSTHCLLCRENYTLVNNDYNKCYLSENYRTGYYLDKKKNMLFPCLENCDFCENDFQCSKCTGNYTMFASGSYCGSCLAFMININEKLTEENIEKLILEYINDYKNEYDIVVLYSNPSMNYSILIYRTYQCTELLLNEGYFQVNTKDLEERLNKRFDNKGNSFVYYMIIYNYKSFLGIYDLDLNKKYDTEKECPTCVRAEYEIKNNYIFETNNLLGRILSKVVSKYNINILNSTDIYFNDICQNMNIEKIDLPIERRRELFYYGNYLTKIACLGEDCDIMNISHEDNLAECKCKFNFNFDKLNINSNETRRLKENNYRKLEDSPDENNFKSISESNPFSIFTCHKEAFNSKNIKHNIGLFIGIGFIFIQLIAFLVLFISLCLRKNFIKNLDNNIKEISASPPIKDLLLIKKQYSSKEDHEHKVQDKDKNESEEIDDHADKEKKVQDNDEDEEDNEEEENFFENENSNFITEINLNTNINNSISGIENNINNNMNNTQLLSENNSLEINSEKRGKSGIFLTKKKYSKFNFELGDIKVDKMSNNIGNSKNYRNLKTNSNTHAKKSNDINNIINNIKSENDFYDTDRNKKLGDSNIDLNNKTDGKNSNDLKVVLDNKKKNQNKKLDDSNIYFENKNNQLEKNGDNSKNEVNKLGDPLVENDEKKINVNNKSKNKALNYSKDSSSNSFIGDNPENTNNNSSKNLNSSFNKNKRESDNILYNSKVSKKDINKINSSNKSNKLLIEEKKEENMDKITQKNSNKILINSETDNNENDLNNNSKNNDEPKNSFKNSKNLLLAIKKNKMKKTNNSRNSNNSSSNIIKEKEDNKNENIDNSKNTKDLILKNNKVDSINSSNNLNNHKNRNKSLENQNDNENNNIKIIKRNSSQSQSSLISNSNNFSEDGNLYSSIKEIKKKLQLDYLSLYEGRKKDKRSFCNIYCHLLTLKQPILDLLSNINSLELNKNFVPFEMKVIRFIFILSLNLFLNSLFLTQKFFKKKYNFFNEKYSLEQTDENYGIINLREQFIFALKHCVIYSLICFIIIIFVQFVMNYSFFNLRKKIWLVIKECNNEQKEEIQKINILFLRYNRYYLIITSINFIFMILFFYYLINFSQAYKGGYIDYITAGFMTWIMLQIFPFITCFISTIFRFCGLKKGHRKFYKLNQAYIF